jgi:hypothetical protein
MSPRVDPRFLPARSTRNVPPKIQGDVQQPDWPDEDSDEDPEYLPSGTETSDTDEGDLDDLSCPDSSSACESSDDDISAAPQL